MLKKHRRPSKPAFLAILLISALGAVHAENPGTLARSTVLFGDGASPPARLDSERGWLLLGSVEWEDLGIPSAADGCVRSWRLKTTYEHQAATGPITLQIRLIRSGPGEGPTFTLPWSEGVDRREEAYSNWFRPDDGELAVAGPVYVEARFIAPPRAPITGRVYSVALESWDAPRDPSAAPGPDKAPSVQLAYAAPLPLRRTDGSSDRGEADGEGSDRSRAGAVEFALSYVESCLTGNLPAFYRAQADALRSLDDGSVISKYKVSPPQGIPGVPDLAAYERLFSYAVYGPEEYRDLFPEWFGADRDWVPGDDCYLFLGSRVKSGGPVPENADYLAFMVAPRTGGGWSVVARPSF